MDKNQLPNNNQLIISLQNGKGLDIKRPCFRLNLRLQHSCEFLMLVLVVPQSNRHCNKKPISVNSNVQLASGPLSLKGTLSSKKKRAKRIMPVLLCECIFKQKINALTLFDLIVWLPRLTATVHIPDPSKHLQSQAMSWKWNVVEVEKPCQRGRSVLDACNKAILKLG